MSQVILSNSERAAIVAPTDVFDEPVGTDTDFPDVLADLDLHAIPDDVVEYGRVRIGETEETRTKLLAELEDMVYGKR